MATRNRLRPTAVAEFSAKDGAKLHSEGPAEDPVTPDCEVFGGWITCRYARNGGGSIVPIHRTVCCAIGPREPKDLALVMQRFINDIYAASSHPWLRDGGQRVLGRHNEQCRSGSAITLLPCSQRYHAKADRRLLRGRP